jgi:hypothetical protein
LAEKQELEMSDMNLGMTDRLRPIHERVAKMVREEIIPLDEEFPKSARKETAGRSPPGRPKFSKA